MDALPEIASTCKVSAMPTIVAFEDGKIKNKFVGAKDFKFIDNFINETFGGKWINMILSNEKRREINTCSWLKFFNIK